MLKRPKSRTIAVFTLALLIILSTPMALAETLDELESRYNQARENIQKTKEKIDANKAQQNTVLTQLDEVDKRLVAASNEALRLGQELDKTTAQRQETERQLAEVQAELDKTLRQLEEAKKQLARYKSILNDRLKNVYKNGKSNYIEVIFQSADFNDLINRVSFLKLIASQDSRLVVKTQEVKLTVEAREAEQERQKNSIEVKRAAIVAEEERIAFLKAEQDRQKAAAGAERNQREALVVQLKQDQAALEEMERQEEADAAALAARIRSWGRIVVSRTGWVWPTGTPADITSPFGPRTAPTSGASTFHQGVDIAVDYGTPIVAANNGVVEDASWFGGYGLYIGINHGDGVASAYGHLSAVAVEPGETVKAGQVIGYVGSTGISTGPHLHFEILVDGVQQNPMNWY